MADSVGFTLFAFHVFLGYFRLFVLLVCLGGFVVLRCVLKYPDFLPITAFESSTVQ